MTSPLGGKVLLPRRGLELVPESASARLAFFPTPCPHETVFSLFARYRCLAESRLDKTAQLLAGHAPVFRGNAEGGLQALVARIVGPFPDARTLAERHTLLPLYRMTLSSSMYEQTSEWLVRRGPRVGAWRTFWPDHLRMCPACRDEQLEAGAARWDRRHQAPGVTVCLTHESYLLDRCPHCSAHLLSDIDISSPPRHCRKCRAKLDAPKATGELEAPLRLARFAEALLDGDMSAVAGRHAALLSAKAGADRGDGGSVMEFLRSTLPEFARDWSMERLEAEVLRITRRHRQVPSREHLAMLLVHATALFADYPQYALACAALSSEDIAVGASAGESPAKTRARPSRRDRFTAQRDLEYARRIPEIARSLYMNPRRTRRITRHLLLSQAGVRAGWKTQFPESQTAAALWEESRAAWLETRLFEAAWELIEKGAGLTASALCHAAGLNGHSLEAVRDFIATYNLSAWNFEPANARSPVRPSRGTSTPGPAARSAELFSD